ncbi:MAG: hypothetical protein H0T51_15905 [Pirellulales bacterium]|nr:hypothetical protein [Pirellulales bacterium]
MADPFLINPFYVENAFLREEAFAPNIRYWQPALPNITGVVTLKFDVPFTIDSASFSGGITAYTVGSDANFDPNATIYLDVSTDNLNWTTIASQTNLNACCSGIAGPWDISSVVAGSNVVYVRSQMFMTTNYAGFGATQFMRQGAPYDPGFFTAASAPPQLISLIDLDFDAPVPSGVNDVNGLGTGFTHWLPGTGGLIPRDDPNLNLLTTPGYLAFTSTRSATSHTNGFGRNLAVLDVPGVLLNQMVGRDFKVTAKFDDVTLRDLSDELLIYVGTSSELILQAGFHDFSAIDPSGATAQYSILGNTGSGDFTFPGADSVRLFANGDEVILSLSRIDGLWSLEWENLTNPATSGAYSGISVPWLGAEPNLYVGLMHMDAQNFSPQTAKIDYFRMDVSPVPEPSSLALILLVSLATWRQGVRR